MSCQQVPQLKGAAHSGVPSPLLCLSVVSKPSYSSSGNDELSQCLLNDVTPGAIMALVRKYSSCPPKIERIISLLSTSPEGEVRCRCQNGMVYKD
jgi:hypothetical protein